MLVDVGGDVLAHGDEPGLGSPLCDAVLLAGAPACGRRGPVGPGAIFGAGCDGELTPDEVLARVAEVAAGGGLLGARGLTPEAAQRLEAAPPCPPRPAPRPSPARGGSARGDPRGRRHVERSPVGAVPSSSTRPSRAPAAGRPRGRGRGSLEAADPSSRLGDPLRAGV